MLGNALITVSIPLLRPINPKVSIILRPIHFLGEAGNVDLINSKSGTPCSIQIILAEGTS